MYRFPYSLDQAIQELCQLSDISLTYDELGECALSSWIDRYKLHQSKEFCRCVADEGDVEQHIDSL